MPGIPFGRLVDRLIQTLERHGASVLVQGLRDRRPARIRVSTSDGHTDCMLYLWAITPGGGPGGERPVHERRIQITGVNEAGFPLEPGTRTIIGGFNEETGVWAFWDARRHSRFSRNSPSCQVNSNTLDEASALGLATQQRPVRALGGSSITGHEVVAAIAPDSLLWYIQHGEALHNVDDDAAEVADLVEATPEEERWFIDESESSEQAARRVELIETLRLHRDARFRPAVLHAYRYRCTVCGTALKLVDAAHILPVTHPQSTDEVTNGLALCRLHHGAYDNGLLGVQSNYRLVLNPDAIHRLEEAQLESGLDVFRRSLPPEITIPNSIEVRPNPGLLRLALEVRQFPARLVC